MKTFFYLFLKVFNEVFFFKTGHLRALPWAYRCYAGMMRVFSLFLFSVAFIVVGIGIKEHSYFNVLLPFVAFIVFGCTSWKLYTGMVSTFYRINYEKCFRVH